MKNNSTYEIFIKLQIILFENFCFKIESLKYLRHVFSDSCWLKFFHQTFSPSPHAFLLLHDFLKIVPGTDLFRLSDEIRDKRSGIDGAHVVLDLFKILIQRPAKVGPGFLEEVIQVTSQVLVHDFSRIHLQLELTDDPKKIVVHARLECGLDNKVWLPVHIPCSSSELRWSHWIHVIDIEYVFNSTFEELSHSHKSKLLQLRRYVCQTSVFHRLVIDQCTG